MDRGEPVRRVHHRNVDTDLVEPLVQELRQHRGGAVEGVAGGDPPPRDARQRQFAPLIGRQHLREPSAVDDEVETLRDVFTREVDEDVTHEGQVLDDVPVVVDDRMVDPRPDRGDVVARRVHGAHRAESLPNNRFLRQSATRNGHELSPKPRVPLYAGVRGSVGRDDHARGRWYRVDEFERGVGRAVSEELAARAEHDRMDHQDVLVHEIVREQRLEECAAPHTVRSPPSCSLSRATAAGTSSPSGVEFGHGNGSVNVVVATYFGMLLSTGVNGLSGWVFQ